MNAVDWGNQKGSICPGDAPGSMHDSHRTDIAFSRLTLSSAVSHARSCALTLSSAFCRAFSRLTLSRPSSRVRSRALTLSSAFCRVLSRALSRALSRVLSRALSRALSRVLSRVAFSRRMCSWSSTRASLASRSRSAPSTSTTSASAPPHAPRPRPRPTTSPPRSGRTRRSRLCPSTLRAGACPRPSTASKVGVLERRIGGGRGSGRGSGRR